MIKEAEKSDRGVAFGISQIKRILNTDISELKDLCKTACLRPKKDKMGSIYFSKDDVEVLQKLKNLNSKIDSIENNTQEAKEEANIVPVEVHAESYPLEKSENNLQIAALERTLANLENNIVDKITSVLSEKMDGLDEVVVDLIRAKTENETLRQRINELNKENFSLKSENASYKPLILGFYKKEETNNFIL